VERTDTEEQLPVQVGPVLLGETSFSTIQGLVQSASSVQRVGAARVAASSQTVSSLGQRDELRRRLLLTVGNPPPAGTEVRLVLAADALEDLFLNHPSADWIQTFTWPSTETVVADTAPPKVEEVHLTDGYLELVFSEPPDAATVPSALDLGDPGVTWTPSPSGTRFRTVTPLAPGNHTLNVTTALLDLFGQPLAEPFLLTFELTATGTSEILFQLPDPRLVSDSAAANRFGWHGQPLDAETGLMYVRHRYYDPETGRFITADPLGYVDGPNLYQYGLNNPVSFADPMGLETHPDKLYVPPGFFMQRYLEGIEVASDSGHGFGNRVLAGIQVGLYFLPAGVEEIGRGMTNLPYAVTKNTVDSAEKFAEAEVTDDPLDKAKLRSEGVGKLCAAFCEAGVAALPAANTSRSPVTRLLRRLWGRMTGTTVATVDEVLLAERRSVAEQFYRQRGVDEDRIAAHLRGVDFSKPVDVVRLPKGTELIQYQLPGGSRGSYFAPPGTPGNQLGFYTSGRQATVYVTTEEVEVLRSFAASTVDDWSMQEFGWQIEAPGGAVQFFTTSGSFAAK
jgi:RHS repeat-associated protein